LIAFSTEENMPNQDVIVPKHDWLLEDVDGFLEDVIEIRLLGAHDAPKALIPLVDLPTGSVPEEDDNWQNSFDRNSTYPPIVVEADPTNRFDPTARFAIIQGNHRVIMWRKWGFTHAPSFVTHAELLSANDIEQIFLADLPALSRGYARLLADRSGKAAA
jgi:hypothetical protein